MTATEQKVMTAILQRMHERAVLSFGTDSETVRRAEDLLRTISGHPDGEKYHANTTKTI